MLKYVVPILNLEKPTTLTVTLARGILSALHHRVRINWAYLVHRNTQKMAQNLWSKKGCALAPFLYHLYEKNGCLTDEERRRLENPPVPGEKSPGKRKAAHSVERSPAKRNSTSGWRSGDQPAKACTGTVGEGESSTG